MPATPPREIHPDVRILYQHGAEGLPAIIEMKGRIVALEQHKRRTSDKLDELYSRQSAAMQTLQTTANQTSEIYKIVDSLHGFWQTLGWIRSAMTSFLKYVVIPISVVVAFIWYVAAGGQWPSWFVALQQLAK